MRGLHLATIFVFAVGCGGAEKKPKTVDDQDTEESDSRRAGALPSTSAEIGALDQDAVEKTFNSTQSELMACRNRGARRVEALGGDVKFFMRIDSTGRLAHAHMEESTLGDRATEKCMLEVLASKTWPQPVGGENGIAQTTAGFDANDVRPPNAWSSDRADSTVQALASEIDSCKNGAAGSFAATVYVEKDGDGGKAVAVGIAPPDEAGEAAVDCLVSALEGGTYEDPGSWIAKVTFEL